MKEMTSIRIPKSIDAGFEIIAANTEKSKIFHVQKALKDYLKQYGESKTSESKGKKLSDLEKIDVSVPTKDNYKRLLQKFKAEYKRKQKRNSSFFSSSPEDLGYTDSSLLDKIIAGDG